MKREEAEGWFVQMLIDKIRDDTYPSAMHMNMVEESIRPEMLEDYLNVLIEKVADDQVPSVTMLRRIQRVTAAIPR